MFWEALIEEVVNKQLALSKQHNNNKGSQQMKRQSIDIHLHEESRSVRLTPREADCLRLMMKGKTMRESALSLSLSNRTVEFYIHNLKLKLNCRRKSDLLRKIFASDFVV